MMVVEVVMVELVVVVGASSHPLFVGVGREDDRGTSHFRERRFAFQASDSSATTPYPQGHPQNLHEYEVKLRD